MDPGLLTRISGGVEQMRIGMMADTYKPHVSGVTNYISTNKKHLEKLGHEVYVFSFGDPTYPDDENGIIRSPGLPIIDTGFYFSFRYTKKAKQYLQMMDILHVHHPFLSGRLALRYARPLHIPIVFTNHTRYDLYIQAYLPILPEGLGETFLQAYLPSFCREVDRVISPSKGMETVLRRLGVDVDISVLPNGVDIGRFRQVLTPCDRRSFGFDNGNVLLVYTGRLSPEKNLSFLIRSFAGVSRAYPQAVLLLIGDGPERTALEELATQAGIQNRVVFTGMVGYEDIPGYLAMCDGFITASITEVHPLSLIEAMAAGLPCLGIDSPGIGDTIQDGVTGLLSKNDLAEFTAKATRMVGDKDLRRAMGESSRKAVEMYAIERTTEDLVALYTGLIDQAKAHRRGVQFYFHTILEKWRQ